jgi:hypothetical protein
MSGASGRAPGPGVPLAPFRLTVVKGEGAGASCEGRGERALHIGKHAANDFVLADKTVSRRHAVIEPTAEGYRIRDLKSLNGTLRGGRKVSEAGTVLADGDEVQLGLAVLRFELMAPAPPADAGERTQVDAVPAPPPAARPAPAPTPRAAAGPPPRPAPPPPPPSPRREPLERYGPFEILDVLDAAGGAELALARDMRANRTVTLRRARAADFGFFARNRFKKTHRQASALRHENVLAPLDVGQDGAYLWVAYPAVHGITATTLLRDCGRELTIEIATYVAREVARGLGAASDALGSACRPLLTGQEVTVGGDGRAALVYVPTPPGTGPADRHRAPEEDAGGQGDVRAAVFSLGVVLYELLAREPIEAGQKTTLRSIDTVRIQVRPTLAEVVMRALEVRPDDRFPRPADLADALEQELERLAPGFGAREAAAWMRERFPEIRGESV